MLWRAAILLSAFLAAGQAEACGPDSDCKLGDRTYRISLPPGTSTGPVGALVYAHGYRGSAKAAMRNSALRDLAHEHGLALVAIKSASSDWLIPGVPENPAETGAREFDYVDAVIADLADRHGIDTDRLIATGFSAGGMMVWNLACHMGDRFAAFLPVAGTFWAPLPRNCSAEPVNLVHVHGTTDKIVPIEGRPIKQTRQGDVMNALELAQRAWGFAPFVSRGDEPRAQGDLDCKVQRNSANKTLAFCLHPGGHSLKMAHLREALALLREAEAY